MPAEPLAMHPDTTGTAGAARPAVPGSAGPDEAERIVAAADHRLATEIAGLDALETFDGDVAGRSRPVWSIVWPKVTAVAAVAVVWQVAVWSGWRAEDVLPGPGTVLARFARNLGTDQMWMAVLTTMRRASVGFAVAVAIGVVLGVVVATFRTARAALGSLITGIQTMPSVAWFPLALVLFNRGEAAILFVVVLGAAPSVANGLLTGSDNIPPVLLRAGRTLGADRGELLRHVVLPASLPSFVSGLKQGWAFAWRSLLAGELIVTIGGNPSIGSQLQQQRADNDTAGMMAVMLVILLIGALVDALVFGRLDRMVRRRSGLLTN